MEFRCLRSGQQYWKKSDFHTQMIFKATLSPYALSCATTYTPLVFIFAETSSHQLWHLQTRCSHTAATWFTEHTQNLTFSLTQKHPVRRVICNVHHTLVVKRSCWKQIKLLQPPRRAPEQQGEQGHCLLFSDLGHYWGVHRSWRSAGLRYWALPGLCANTGTRSSRGIITSLSNST